MEWLYDEFHPVGRDYGQQEEVDVYDASHADFRDIAAESNAALDRLGVAAGQVVIEFGSGTGTFLVEAAKRGAKVHAVDVSETMLVRAREKAAGFSTVTFHHAGFLSYEHGGPAADAIATTFAFHHLPDFWKGVALRRMAGMLRDGGRLYLRDVIIGSDCAVENIRAFIDAQHAAGGDFLREDAIGHFRDENSTYDWVMDGLLERAGFAIDGRTFEQGVIGTYLCTKRVAGG